MRILELVPSLAVGGAERVVALLALALRREGADAGIVALSARCGSWIEDELDAEGVPIVALGKGLGFDPRIVARLTRVLRAARPDVVHTHLHVLKYLVPALAASGRRPAVVHTLHNLAAHEAGRSDRVIQRLVFRFGGVPVAIGDEVARSVAGVYGRPAGATVPNGIPVAAYRATDEARARVRAALGVGPSTPVVLAVGRLNRQKNHALAVAAMADPRLRALGAVLWIAGQGELRGALERQAGPGVRLLGVRGDVPELLAACDVFVLSSDYEGNPLVVMEAMAAGRPVVATAVGCVPELVPEPCGALVPPGDGARLADAIVRTLAPGVAASRGAAAAREAGARFDVSLMARRYLEVFRAAPRWPAAPR